MNRLAVALVFFVIAPTTGLSQRQESNKEPEGVVRQLIKEEKLDAAIKTLEKALKDEPLDADLWRLRSDLATALIYEGESAAAFDQNTKLLDYLLAAKQPPMDLFPPTLTSINAGLMVSGRKDEIIPTIDRVEKRVRELLANKAPSLDLIALLSIRDAKAKVVLWDSKEAARDMYRADYAAMEKLHGVHNTVVTAEVLLTAIGNMLIMFPDEERIPLFNKHQELARRFYDQGHLKMASRYIDVGSNEVWRVREDNPERAVMLVDDLRAAAKEFSRDPEAKKLFTTYLLDQVEPGARALLKVKKLIGQASPDLSSATWIGVEEKPTLAGRIVLLNFWAAWCQPCVSSFPELNRLQATYAADVQIVGVTGYFSLSWPKTARDPVRTFEDVPHAVEREIIQRFLAKHGVKYPTVVHDKKSGIPADFGLTEYPQFVLIDRKGIVRLVTTGAGNDKIAAIESMIEKMIAESAPR